MLAELGERAQPLELPRFGTAAGYLVEDTASAVLVGVFPDEAAAPSAEAGRMAGSLPVVWTLGDDEAACVGKLEILIDRLHLEGKRRGSTVSHDVHLHEISGTHPAPPRQRIGGRPTLVIEGPVPTLLVSILGFGALIELADHIGNASRPESGAADDQS